ncbi:uncharacterized protein LOC143711004 isoform X3 [Siphateles boraxobius]|uniref:uncharacterized protein LOC143711004 isoform X3 n=1 Tax=Siphateles boraxobius TaxID=180520 RepID=UPI004064122F
MITSVNEDLLLTELTTVNWQQEAEYEGLGSPELPQYDWQQDTPSDEAMCSPECLPHRTPQSQRFASSAPAGCTAVERLLLEGPEDRP